MIDEKYRPDYSVNENGSTSSNYEARKFFFYGTVPEVSRASQLVKLPLSNIYNEHAFYGVLDNDGDVISPKIDSKMSNFSIVGYADETSEPLYLQNFVAQALSDMRNDLNNKLLTCFDVNTSNELRNSPFFNFKVYDAYKKSIELNTVNTAKGDFLGALFRQYVLKNSFLNSKIKNVKSFINNFIEFIINNNLGPITATRTQCYNSFISFNTSISFKIAKDDPGNDVNKFNKFYNDLGFEQFCKTCMQYGFMIDKNIPFILTADLASPQMKKYWSIYSNNISDLIKNRYFKIFESDIGYLKVFFWVAYQQFIQGNEYFPQDINNACSKDLNIFSNLNSRKRENYKIFERFYTNFSEKFWIRLYIYLKVMDMKINMHQKEFDAFVYKAYQYYIPQDLDNKFVHKFINSKFDETQNQNYFDYLRNKNSVVQEEELSERPASSGVHRIIF